MQAEPVRIGVIGAGWWAAENHLPVLRAHRDMAPGACPQAAPVEVFVYLVRGRPAENRSDATVGARLVEVLDAARVEHAG